MKGVYRNLSILALLLVLLSGCKTTVPEQSTPSTTETQQPETILADPSETSEQLPEPQPVETESETEHGSTEITESPPVPELEETALAFFADYAVPLPEEIPSHSVVDGYKLSLPYTPKYSMSDVYYFQITLPKMVQESEEAAAWNRTIVTMCYSRYNEYLTMLANEPKENYYSLEMTWEAYESGDITVVLLREKGGILGSGAWGVSVSVVYFDKGTGKFLTPDQFLYSHTNGEWSVEKVLTTMNTDARVMDDGDEPFILPMDNIYGYIPAENGAFYILYLGYTVEGLPLSAAVCQDGTIEDIIGSRESYRYPWLDTFLPSGSYRRTCSHRVKNTDVFLLGFDSTEPIVYMAMEGTFTKLDLQLSENSLDDIQFSSATVACIQDIGWTGYADIIVELYELYDEEKVQATGKQFIYEYVRYRYRWNNGRAEVTYLGSLTAGEVDGQTWVHTPNRNMDLPDETALAMSFFEPYRVPLPEKLPESGVVQGYTLSLPYTCHYYPDELYSFDISLPQLTRESPAAVQWNWDIITRYYTSFKHILHPLSTGKRDNSISTDVTWKSCTSGDITVVCTREWTGYLTSGAWWEQFTIDYFDNATGEFVTADVFLERHTDGKYTPESVLAAMNEAAVEKTENDVPYPIEADKVFGYLPTENGGFYVVYERYSIEATLCGMVLFQNDEIYPPVSWQNR